MTPRDFRKLALGLPETEERMHMHHPDFRVAGKIFATLAYPDKEWAMVKVTPVEQEMLVRAEPEVFTPVKGKWGLKGCTSVKLKAAKKTIVRGALAAAWRLAAPADVARRTRVGLAAAVGETKATKASPSKRRSFGRVSARGSR